jgi:FG-GAP repeat protein
MAFTKAAAQGGRASASRAYSRSRAQSDVPRARLLVAPIFLIALAVVALVGAGPVRAQAGAEAAPQASIALRADPFAQLGEKLAATIAGESGLGGFGSAVAISGDGMTAIVGAPGDAGGRGAAWVFTREGSTWTQQSEKLTDGEVTGGSLPEPTAFGASVAISADGTTAVVGGPGDAAGAGAMWVFTREGSTWTQQGEKLTGGEEEGAAELGRSVAISDDGTTSLAGGPRDAKSLGAAWVFTREGATWVQQGAKLLAAHEAGHGQFGGSVALSGDGDTALIGARADHSFTNTGAAWAFSRSGSAWTQEGEKLTGAGETSGGEFASSVTLSDDGETALIGGVANEGGTGAAWAFTHEGSTWLQQGEKLTSGEASPTAFGNAVALSANGTKALVGASGDLLEAGAAWIFSSEGAGWVRQGAKLTGGDETGAAAFGSSVALSDGAHTALVGGPQDGLGAGALWTFADGASEELPLGSETDVNGSGKPHVSGSGLSGGTAESVAPRPHARGGLSTASASSTRLATLFAHALAPSGSAARIGALLRRGAFVAPLSSFAPGKAVIYWYLPARRAAHSSKLAPPLLIAGGKVVFRKAGTAAIVVRLTRAGKQLLKRSKRVSLSAKAMFAPNGAAAIRAQRGFVLER